MGEEEWRHFVCGALCEKCVPSEKCVCIPRFYFPGKTPASVPLGERESMETGANVYFSCLWLSFFSFSFFTRSILGIYLSPSVSFLLLYISSPPPFFVPLAIKFYERRNGFSRLIAWIFSTIKRFKLTNNIFTTTFRGEIESGNFCLNSCTAFERSEATTCRFNRQHKVITWLRYENTTRILRSRARAFPFASLFARMRLAPMRVPQIVLQNARFSSFATSRPNWINPELKGISKRACYVNRKHIRNEAGQQNFGKIRIPYLLRFYCPLWTRITTCVAYASQSIGKAKRIVDTCVWQRRNRRGFWSLKGEEGGSVEREDK